MKTITFLCTILMLIHFGKVSVAEVSDSISDKFTKADTVRGSLLPERTWWDVLRYDITVKPDYKSKTISGMNDIRYKVLKKDHQLIMQ
ncbi:MAG: M1 family peptidase, partial [bacterium]